MSNVQLVKPVSVNYFFSRVCNFSCGFCFHTPKSEFILSLSEAKSGLANLQSSGMLKINFSGGEPFLYADRFLGPMVKFCKQDLQLESVSIVSNGSRIQRAWLEEYGPYVDILAISCDSFSQETNRRIGRGTGGRNIEQLYKIRRWCQEFEIKFKINTVVNAFNWQEDMNERISALQPFRWKCFQVLIVKGENSGEEGDRRDARRFQITDEQFQSFIRRHCQQECLIPEDNKLMRNSYLLLDEKMRFLNCRDGGKNPTQSILEVGVEEALENSGFDPVLFQERGGIYDWS